MCFVITILPIAHNTHQFLLLLVLSSHLSRSPLVIHHFLCFFLCLVVAKNKQFVYQSRGRAAPLYTST